MLVSVRVTVGKRSGLPNVKVVVVKAPAVAFAVFCNK